MPVWAALGCHPDPWAVVFSSDGNSSVGEVWEVEEFDCMMGKFFSALKCAPSLMKLEIHYNFILLLWVSCRPSYLSGTSHNFSETLSLYLWNEESNVLLGLNETVYVKEFLNTESCSLYVSHYYKTTTGRDDSCSHQLHFCRTSKVFLEQETVLPMGTLEDI